MAGHVFLGWKLSLRFTCLYKNLFLSSCLLKYLVFAFSQLLEENANDFIDVPFALSIIIFHSLKRTSEHIESRMLDIAHDNVSFYSVAKHCSSFNMTLSHMAVSRDWSDQTAFSVTRGWIGTCNRWERFWNTKLKTLEVFEWNCLVIGQENVFSYRQGPYIKRYHQFLKTTGKEHQTISSLLLLPDGVFNR